MIALRVHLKSQKDLRETEGFAKSCSRKKLFWKVPQISLESTFDEVFFLVKLQPVALLQKETATFLRLLKF